MARKRLIALLAVVAMIVPMLTLTACEGNTNGTTKPEDQEPVSLRLMTSWTSGSAAYEQITQALADFKTANPNITVVHDALPSADLRTKLTTEMATGNPPDISWCVLSYAREFIKDNKIIDWAPVFDDPRHPEFKQWFDEKSLYFAKSPDGKIMMVPQEASIDGLYYDTKLFADNGWTPPQNFDQFIDIIGKAKAKGMVGIAVGGKDMRFAWMASALLVRAGGLTKANELCLGTDATRFSNPDYGFVGAMEKFKELVDAEAFSPSVLGMSAAEADTMFANNQAAFYYEGAWKPGNFKTNGSQEFVDRLERVNFPAMTDMPGDVDINVGGNIIGFFIASGLPDAKTQACIKVAKVIASPEFNVPIMEKGGFVYAGNATYDETKVSKVMNQLIKAYRDAKGFIPSMDSLAPPSVDLAIKQTVMPGIITGEYDVDEAVAEVQRVMQEYLDSAKK
ncbi:MAG: extracellular solute-binding protein [Clostridia bacterium]|nr:extracellular solute-binding protein [Clostridia bacterium]